MSDLTDVRFFLASLIRPIVKEAIREEIHALNSTPPPLSNAVPHGDFKWVQSLFPSVPESTVRQWDASGKIPGSSKFGKRKIYHKETVLNWIRSQTDKPNPNAADLLQSAEEQFNRQLAKGRGVPA